MKKWLYIVLAYLAFCVSTLFHEWAHSFTATLFGVKEGVFDIHYSFMPFLMGIHEKVDYALVATLPSWQGILIAGSGLIANGLMAILAMLFMRLCTRPVTIFMLFALAFFNISDWFNYLVLRNIFPRGDIVHMINFGFPYTILLIGGVVSSLFFVYLLFFPSRKYVNNCVTFSAETETKMLRTMIVVFTAMQIGELSNDLFMY